MTRYAPNDTVEERGVTLPCGLIAYDEEQVAATSLGSTLTFDTVDGVFGDIDIDGVDFGWYTEAEAREAADTLTLEYIVRTRGAAPAPRHPRREA